LPVCLYIAQKFIYAPWDGKLGLRDISVGSYVAAGQKVVWLQRVDPIFADFAVTEEDYGRIAGGQKVAARFNAWPGEIFTGQVVTVDARMSAESRMITVRAEIANPDGRLLPGMYANVEVSAGKPADVITVPQTAVTFSLYGDNVFVVVPATASDPAAKPDALVIERRFVKVGEILMGIVVDGVSEVLNLTAADYCFILDPCWNPAVEAQAIDRAYRMGQTRHVFAYRMICKDTVEEKILSLQTNKQDLADSIIGDENTVLRDLTEEDLRMLLG